ncbi:MAG: type II toxin-antitoxin system VapC family toxin [Campylobacterales bacterium]|nr:type II toxin-antitoxin system VapC family toxin [Campylobacterales bacterium]
MKYLLDTNIISELISKQPNKNVLTFLEKQAESSIFLSVITIGEIKSGIEKLQDHNKKTKLLTWLYDDLLKRFSGKIVDIDVEVMLEWGKLNQKLKSMGKPMPIMDSLIASTSRNKNFILVTRNEKDFQNLDINIINPFNITSVEE